MDLESLASAYLLRREVAKFNTSTATSVVSSTAEQINSSNQDAVTIEIGSNTSKAEIYKHIEDYNEGKSYLSKNTASKIREDASNTFDTLSHDNPKASSLYSAYLTAGFSYNSKVRFVNNISSTVKNSANIQNAYKTKA